MSADVINPLDRIAVMSADPRLQDSLNRRLESYHRALEQLQARALLEPRAVPPARAYDGQLALCDGDHWDGAGTGEHALMYYHLSQWWPLLDSRHVAAADPHGQYWHKTQDLAGASLVLDGPVLMPVGATVAPWALSRISPYHVSADLAVGALEFDGTAKQSGVYLMSLYLDISGAIKGEYRFSFFVDGSQAGPEFRVMLDNQPTVGAISWSHLVRINAAASIDFRSTVAPGGFTIESADWSVIRVSPAGDMAIPPGVMVR